MVSWKWPALANKIFSDVPGVNVLLNALLKQDPAGTTDIPAGAKRWADGADGKQFQVFNGSTWESAGKLDHDVASVDGKSVSVSVVPDTIPVRDANGEIPGDISGNAATATKANELSETNPVAMGGTGATTAEQARANLGTPPKSHAASSTEYGAGTSALYGHLKSHDEPDSTLTADSGHAFSPAGAAAMQESLGGLLNDTQGAVSSLDSSLRSLIAQEVGDAESTASQQVSALDRTLRALIAEEVAKCLKLSGGDVQGVISLLGTWGDFLGKVGGAVGDNNGCLRLTGGGYKAAEAGAYMQLFAKDHPTRPGWIELIANDGSSSATSALIAKPDKTLTWAGESVVTSTRGTANAIRDLHVFTGNTAGAKTTLPSGGTWRYWYMYGPAAFTAMASGAAAGGSTLSILGTAYAGFAIRIK